MLSEELKGLLIQVLTSWQVIAMAVVLLLYLLLVFYAARPHHKRPRLAMSSAIKAFKERKARAPKGEPEVETSGDDGLGLEKE
jgi:flagellar biosynthesis/type III secretory pathway M-ring protein FliF/YscJ